MAAKKFPVKITVYKKFDCSELPDYTTGCQAVEVGQEFIVKEDGKMPEGFCTWAWNDIWAALTALRFGGNLTYSKTDGLHYGACTDGRSPVVFRMERIEG
ncbi:MAG: TIGR04076 family protein [Eubacteriales bacterium]|nr:TIGR04076 family protein [Eubacteriales bacterium]